MTDAQIIALEGLASVIGHEKVGLIEVLKNVDISNVSMNPLTGTIPIVGPIINSVQQQSEKALPGNVSQEKLPSPSQNELSSE